MAGIVVGARIAYQPFWVDLSRRVFVIGGAFVGYFVGGFVWKVVAPLVHRWVASPTDQPPFTTIAPYQSGEIIFIVSALIMLTCLVLGAWIAHLIVKSLVIST